MNSIHDMGGMHGFGKVAIEEGDYIFKSEWQRRAFGLTETLLCAIPGNADVHRQELERIPAVDYLQKDYFEKWVIATEALLKQAGLVSQEELDAGKKLFDIENPEAHPAIDAKTIVEVFKAGAELKFPNDGQPAKFAEGDIVRVINNHAKGHTRVPRYVRGHLGKIVSDEGVFQFADTLAAGEGACPQHCYTVQFSAETLWGEDAGKNELMYVDLWESYLEPA